MRARDAQGKFVVGTEVNHKQAAQWKLEADHGAARREHNKLSDLAEMAADAKHASDAAKKEYFELKKTTQAQAQERSLDEILHNAKAGVAAANAAVDTVSEKDAAAWRKANNVSDNDDP